jgi:transketolase
MREVLSQFLTEKVKLDHSVYVFSGDHGYALFDDLRNKFPCHFINVGVSEQAMVGYAAGMAKEGMRPIVYGLSAFIPIRVLEFIKMDVCYESLPVIFLGDGAGLVYATLGPSHQCSEDISSLRSVPNITILSPADNSEMSACLEYAYLLKSPVYIRIGKADKIQIHSNAKISLKPELIPINTFPNSTCIVATGSMLDVGSEFSNKYNLSLFSAPFIHPLNIDRVFDQIKSFDAVVTLEEHSSVGGLGSIIAEIVSDRPESKKIRVQRIGISNRFTKYCGSYEYAIKEHGLDYESIEKHLINLKLI